MTARVHWFCTNLGQKAKNHLNPGENTLFTRFLMCPSIIFSECRPEARKGVFLGARLKKHGFEWSQVHSQKVYRWTHSVEGGQVYIPGVPPSGIGRYGQKSLPDPRTRPVQGPWAQNASQMTKSVQNGPKMAQNGPCGARQGPFLVILGPFWSSGTDKTHKCALYCSYGSLYGQFLCYAG